MPTMTIRCASCGGDVEVEYEEDEVDNGDPSTPYHESWALVVITETETCECGHVMTNSEIYKAESQIMERLYGSFGDPGI